MRKTLNRVSIEGRIYDKSQLEMKKVQNSSSANFGQEFIGGSIDVATDDEGLNIVTVYFTFVQPTFKSGKVNNTYGVLKDVIENGRTILSDGIENATSIKIDAAIGLNDFYTNRNGEETLVSAKRFVGSFANIINRPTDNMNDRNKFECDMLINGTTMVEADEENHIEQDYLKVRGAIFDFRNAILPIEFIVKNPGGIKYFESLDASSQNLTFTKVWGTVKNETIIDRREEESAFGEPSIREFKRNIREWIINGTAKPDLVYEVGDAETGITADEIKKALADREVYLADIKKRADEYQASKNASVASAPASVGGFSF